ncbi:1-acyl-sn-glycerol-3-phosphate acyltransferase [Natronospira proteinivora]|uniref:1-acyl-sn-glycerol-3-phosphate acyltransferase n=1 Tax=Natronospira proteinivora TaxID=1807133 RepID=A0ABT1GBG3_9GAMM|nr:acyltransferase [Natronospira proteinivora]MCP1728627.1 1-acyl-sn-glycerol-3-phosphate acyltransferase [Natronospira proteinivora]
MNQFRGLFTQLIILPVTITLIIPMMLVAILKLLIPIRVFRRRCTRIVLGIGELWAWLVTGVFRFAHQTRYEINPLPPVDRDHSYLVICNHQSWVDIPVLMAVFDGRVPFYRFFLKKQLMWLPFLGIAFWALEYPFMQRHSKAYLEKHPEKQGEDLKITQKACAKMRGIPATIINYPEGTRCTPTKQAKQGSPYKHLLRPKAGGISFVLSSMGDQLDALLDVTIHYPDGVPGFWQFLCNGVSRIQVDVQKRPLPKDLLHGDYQNDPEFRQRFQTWVNQLWEEKDQRLEAMKG